MTAPPPQPTRLEAAQSWLTRAVFGQLGRTWRRASLTMLALLVGFWLGQNLTSVMRLWAHGSRPAVVLGLLLLLELVVRLRSRLLRGEAGLAWIVGDNLRIGLTYAVVLEAFKLGS